MVRRRVEAESAAAVRHLPPHRLPRPAGCTRAGSSRLVPSPAVDLLSLPVRAATSSPLVVVPVHTDPVAAAKHGCERGDPRRGYSRGAAASGVSGDAPSRDEAGSPPLTSSFANPEQLCGEVTYIIVFSLVQMLPPNEISCFP
ncbi:unnamed protein product [Urochloa humidicola]